ncbi:MAG: hypothetical protein HY776_01340 [Actinobacteria bacterium]|nr:hypothetical protein [Actinomycetota bacterium]
MSELDTQTEIASNLKYLNNEQRQNFETRLESIAKKLAGLISHTFHSLLTIHLSLIYDL